MKALSSPDEVLEYVQSKNPPPKGCTNESTMSNQPISLFFKEQFIEYQEEKKKFCFTHQETPLDLERVAREGLPAPLTSYFDTAWIGIVYIYRVELKKNAEVDGGYYYLTKGSEIKEIKQVFNPDEIESIPRQEVISR